MFSKSLFKQSCKANGVLWAVITFATCFMLACVMLIAGGGNIVEAKRAISDTIIQGELTSQMQSRSINYYIMAEEGMEKFDETFAEELQKAIANGDMKAPQTAYANSVSGLIGYAKSIAQDKGYEEGSRGEQEIIGLMLTVLNPINATGKYDFDGFYLDLGETPPRYNVESIMTTDPVQRKLYRDAYVADNSAIFMSGNMIKDENVQMVIAAISQFGVTPEQYEEYGFKDYNKVKEISVSALIDFRANLAHRIEHIKPGETKEGIVAELTKDISQSLLASLPKEVADTLEEVGKMDMYGVLIGSVFFRMAGLLLPIIYMIMTANSLIAGQVDSGSMAYVLSSSIKRRAVTFTQAIYLIGSLFAMFCCTTITSLVCFALVDVNSEITFARLLLLNLGAFLVMFAMSGICFFGSCWFNRSKHSMALGGGLNMFFLVATMLGLFGSTVMPKIIRMKALNTFNYVSLISLFDVVSILGGTLTYLWKFAILIVLGISLYIAGSLKFCKKDLPL